MRIFLILCLVSCASLFAHDMDYKYDVSARVEYDTGRFVMSDETYNESKLRRARLSHDGSFYKKSFFYEVEVDVSDDVEFKDNFIGFQNKLTLTDSDYRFKLGNIKVPFSFDAYTGSKNSSFMESPLTDVLTQSRKLGFEGLVSNTYENHRINAFFGILTNSIDEEREKEAQKVREVAKVTYSYKFDKNKLVHFGASYLYSDVNGDKVTYKQEAESDIIRDKFVSTKVKNVNESKDLGIEALYIDDSFHFQAEYVQSKLDALSDDYIFSGYYAQVGYFLFGSTKDFKRKSSKFSSKGIKYGDVELAFRYSFIDLNDKDEQGGTQKDYNFAANWYISKNLKIMANYIIALPQSDDYDGRFQLAQARGILTF